MSAPRAGPRKRARLKPAASMAMPLSMSSSPTRSGMTALQAGKLREKATPMVPVAARITGRPARSKEAKMARVKAASIITPWVETMMALRLRRSAREPA